MLMNVTRNPVCEIQHVSILLINLNVNARLVILVNVVNLKLMNVFQIPAKTMHHVLIRYSSNDFMPDFHFYTLLKMLENQGFSDVLRGYRKEQLAISLNSFMAEVPII